VVGVRAPRLSIANHILFIFGKILAHQCLHLVGGVLFGAPSRHSKVTPSTDSAKLGGGVGRASGYQRLATNG
jgi:hypothetical protein